MTTAPVDAAALPPYTFRQPCWQCRRRAPALVIFDRDCRDVTGAHYHRECLACAARWLERCARAAQ
jgi:hypothetical protein